MILRKPKTYLFSNASLFFELIRYYFFNFRDGEKRDKIMNYLISNQRESKKEKKGNYQSKSGRKQKEKKENSQSKNGRK